MGTLSVPMTVLMTHGGEKPHWYNSISRGPFPKCAFTWVFFCLAGSVVSCGSFQVHETGLLTGSVH